MGCTRMEYDYNTILRFVYWLRFHAHRHIFCSGKKTKWDFDDAGDRLFFERKTLVLGYYYHNHKKLFLRKMIKKF